MKGAFMNVGRETETSENKESLAQLDKGVKSLTAMLNKHHQGTLYFGVSDEGEVIGYRIGKNDDADIRERIAVLAEPKFMYTINHLEDEGGRPYIKVSAFGGDTPYSCDGRYYIRNASSDERMDNAMVRRAIISGDFDALKETRSPDQNPTFLSLQAYFLANGIHYREGDSFLANYGLFNGKGEYNLLAYLLSDRNSVSVKVVRFKGKDKTEMEERNEFGNRCLLSAAQAVLDYVRAQNATRVDLSSGLRREIKLFDYECFREAWINAVAHNDWLHMIPPSVFLYEDRIEILSYGEPPFSLSKEDFFKGRSQPVNKALFTVLSLSDFVEQSGHGVPTIVRSYSEKAFDFSSNMVMVTLPFAWPLGKGDSQKEGQGQFANLLKNEIKIYTFLLNHPEATLSEASSDCGLSLGGTKKIVASLKKKELIERIGSKTNGKWVKP